ncbi:MAG TPA: VOC family protein [Gammaproteobacteria bacterium]|nr:VOC family protein [Gammaproteobacteria bacterium]
MTVHGLHHVNIRVPAEEVLRLRDFYCEVVGLKEGPRPPFRAPGIWLYADDQAVVHLSETRADESMPPLPERRSALNHVALRCTGLEDFVARLESAQIEYRLSEVPLTAERQLFFRDPSGVGVELIFPLHGAET